MVSVAAATASEPAAIDPICGPGGFGARIADIQRSRYVPYAAGERILDRFRSLYGHPQVTRPPCLMVYSETNVGKTTLALKFLRDIEQETGNEAGKRPVVYFRCPPIVDHGSFLDSALRSISVPFRTSNRPAAKWNQLLQVLPTTKTRLIIVDEVNQLVTAKPDMRLMLLNVMKSLSNELGIPVVAMGTREAVRIFQTDQQLGNRFEPVSLDSWKFGPDYGAFLRLFIADLGLRGMQPAPSKEFAARVYEMAEKLTGETCRILREAAIKAIESGREIIDDETLDAISWTKPSERRRQAEKR